MSSFLLENTAQAAGRDRTYPRDRKTFDRKKIIENIRDHDPEIIQMMQNLRDMQKEARHLAHEYGNQTSEEQKRDIENRLRFITEEILRNQFVVTERTLDHRAERYEQLRDRHQKIKEHRIFQI